MKINTKDKIKIISVVSETIGYLKGEQSLIIQKESKNNNINIIKKLEDIQNIFIQVDEFDNIEKNETN
jgi:hypothetical protein